MFGAIRVNMFMLVAKGLLGVGSPVAVAVGVRLTIDSVGLLVAVDLSLRREVRRGG